MEKFIKNILVTGGAGFIGSHTLITLLENGYRLIILDSLVNSSEKVIKRVLTLSNLQDKKRESMAIFIKGDVRDQKLLINIFEKYTNSLQSIVAVVHFAGLKSVFESTKFPLHYWDSNVSGTINLLKIMERFNCLNFVFSSSATIYGTNNKNLLIKENDVINPINPYGQTKDVIEQILNNLIAVKNKKWSIAILRYFNPIGAHKSGLIGENSKGFPNNLMPIINKVAFKEIKELEIFGNDWNTPDGTGVRDYIHVMDLAEGHLLALEYILDKNNKSNFIKLNLGTGTGTSVLELVDTFSRVNGVEIPYKFSARRDGDVSYSVADISQAKSKINWNPKRNLKEMCRDSWNSYKKQKDYKFRKLH